MKSLAEPRTPQLDSKVKKGAAVDNKKPALVEHTEVK